MAFSTPRRVVLGLPSPSCRVCADGRTDGHVTITSQPKFLGSIGYQIYLAMELRWRALPAGFANSYNFYFICLFVFFFSGDKVIATLHITNITVKDDADFGRYSCVGLNSSGGASRLGFTVKVTPSM